MNIFVKKCSLVLLFWGVGRADGYLRRLVDSNGIQNRDGDQTEKTCSLPAPSKTISEIFVFGDSFSDVGNVFAASDRTEPSAPPYFRGRYSNGRVYVEFMAQTLGISVTTETDFAWGGATTSNSYIPSQSTFLNAPVPSVSEQVHAYLTKFAKQPQQQQTVNTEHAVFIVNAGYNDYWWYAYLNEGDTVAMATTALPDVADHVTDNLLRAMDLLVEEGGAQRILVADLPNMTMFPDAESKSPEVVRAYQEFSSLHNEFLYAKLDRYQQLHRAVDLRLLPFRDVMQSIIDDATCLGMVAANLWVGCYKAGEVCDDPFAGIFWDEWHPLTWHHKRIADAGIEVLSRSK